jgi:uncharacterized protein (TIGR03067 family)
MFRSALVLGGIFISAMVAVAADPKTASDLDQIQGNWKMLQCEYEGSPQMPADLMKQVTGVYDKSEYFLYFADKDPQGKPKVLLLAVANVTLNPDVNPKVISFEFAEGPKKGVKSHGIYEIVGNQLKLCYCQGDKPRPTEFKSNPGSGHFLETWARQVK